MPQLPGIGRNGIVNSVRRLSGLTNPGYRAVNSSADFIAGMVANLEANSTTGEPELVVASNTSTAIIGLFYCNKTTSFYRPIVDEEQTFGTSPNTSWIIYLGHANVKASSVKITDSTGATTYTETTDYVVTTTNGYITRTSTGSIGATDDVLVTYQYEDPNLSGIDETLGSGLGATLEDRGEVATLIYDTSVAYSVMDDLYVTAGGYITNTSGTTKIGVVTKPPTADNPELHLKLQL